MARLIDADALCRHLSDWQYGSMTDGKHDVEYMVIENVIEGIEKEPTIDAVQVIRCAECYFWNKEPSQTAMPEVHTCRFWRIGTICVDYCARASRDGLLKAMSDDRKDIDEEIERAWEYAETD